MKFSYAMRYAVEQMKRRGPIHRVRWYWVHDKDGMSCMFSDVTLQALRRRGMVIITENDGIHEQRAKLAEHVK